MNAQGSTVTWDLYAHLMKSTNQEGLSGLEQSGSKTVGLNEKEATAKTVTS
jgi:hypothetical protein